MSEKPKTAAQALAKWVVYCPDKPKVAERAVRLLAENGWEIVPATELAALREQGEP